MKNNNIKKDNEKISSEKTNKKELNYKEIKSEEAKSEEAKSIKSENNSADDKNIKEENKYLKNSIILLIGKFSSQIIAMLLIPLFTFYLTKADYGTVDLILTYIFILIPVLLLSIDNGAFRFLIDKRGDITGAKKVISNTFIFMNNQLLFVAGIGIIIGLFVDSPLYKFALINLLTAMVFNTIIQVARGLGENIKYTIASVIVAITNLIVNLILIMGLHFDGVSIFIASILANILAIAYMFHSLKLSSKIDFKLKDNTLIKDMLKYSLPMLPNTLSWWIVNASDKTIITIFMGAGANGIYSIATKFSNVINGVLSIVILAWQESAALKIDDEDRDEFFTKNIEDTLIMFTMLIAGVLVFLSFGFEYLVGTDFAESYKYIPILLISLIFTVLSALYGGIYVAKKLSGEISKTSIAASVLNIIFNIITIPFFGLYAAAFSTLASYMLMAIYRIIDSRKYVNIKFNIPRIILSCSLTLVAIIIYYIHNPILGIVSTFVYGILFMVINKGMVQDLMYIITKRIKPKKIAKD